MPIYEYKCNKCGEIMEEIQKFSDPPLKKCSHCGGKLNKLMSLNTFHLKGSGWYATDYANKKGPGAPTSESRDKVEKDTKPAKKEETSNKPDKNETTTL